jgi:hypothetical protein
MHFYMEVYKAVCIDHNVDPNFLPLRNNYTSKHTNLFFYVRILGWPTAKLKMHTSDRILKLQIIFKVILCNFLE